MNEKRCLTAKEESILWRWCRRKRHGIYAFGKLYTVLLL